VLLDLVLVRGISAAVCCWLPTVILPIWAEIWPPLSWCCSGAY